MNKRQQERLALEGNSVFTDLRLERDTLKEQNAALLEALERIIATHDETCAGRDCGISGIDKARAAIRAAKGESNG